MKTDKLPSHLINSEAEAEAANLLCSLSILLDTHKMTQVKRNTEVTKTASAA